MLDSNSLREESPKKEKNSYVLNKMQVSVDEIGVEFDEQNSRSLVNDLKVFGIDNQDFSGLGLMQKQINPNKAERGEEFF